MALPTITGEFRVGTDYDLKYSPSGIAVGSFRAVANSARKVGDDWETTGEIWVSATLFGPLAEQTAEWSPSKGGKVHMTGTIQVDKYTNRDGEERESLKVIVRAIGPVEDRRDRDTAPAQQRAPSQGADPWGGPPAGSEEPPF